MQVKKIKVLKNKKRKLVINNPKSLRIDVNLQAKARFTLFCFCYHPADLVIVSQQNYDDSQLQVYLFAKIENETKVKFLSYQNGMQTQVKFIANFIVCEKSSLEVDLHSIIDINGTNSVVSQNVQYLQFQANSRVRISPKQFLLCPSASMDHGVAKIKLSNKEISYLSSRSDLNINNLITQSLELDIVQKSKLIIC